MTTEIVSRGSRPVERQASLDLGRLEARATLRVQEVAEMAVVKR